MRPISISWEDLGRSRSSSSREKLDHDVAREVDHGVAFDARRRSSRIKELEPKKLLQELFELFNCRGASAGGHKKKDTGNLSKQISNLNLPYLKDLLQLLELYDNTNPSDSDSIDNIVRRICIELVHLQENIGGSNIKTLRRNKKRHNTRNKNSILNGTKKHYRKKYKTKKSYFL
jgi:hypothetical protein